MGKNSIKVKTKPFTVASKVKEAIGENGFRSSGDFNEALAEKVGGIIEGAIIRAQENGRSTVRPADL